MLSVPQSVKATVSGYLPPLSAWTTHGHHQSQNHDHHDEDDDDTDEADQDAEQ
jgi:hypothetical protein